MPPRGKPINPFRAEAIRLGHKVYADDRDCFVCGTNNRYTRNSACVACSIAKGKARYANLTQEQKDAHAARDHQRYLNRLADGRE